MKITVEPCQLVGRHEAGSDAAWQNHFSGKYKIQISLRVGKRNDTFWNSCDRCQTSAPKAVGKILFF